MGDAVAISMSKETMEMIQKVSEAIDASGKVELMFIEERAERRQAVSDIWEKLRELQNDFRTSKTKERVVERAAPQAPSEVAKMTISMDRESMLAEGLELARIEKEMATYRAQMQELRFMCEGAASAKSGGGDTTQLSKKCEDLSVEVTNLRGLWVEVQMGLSMSAVRASRIALRTADLSEQGRKQALTILEGKEEEIARQFEVMRQDRGVNWSPQLMIPDPLDSALQDGGVVTADSTPYSLCATQKTSATQGSEKSGRFQDEGLYSLGAGVGL